MSALKGLATFQQIYGRLNRNGLQAVLDAFSEAQIAEYSVEQAERAALLLLQCDLGSDAYREIWIDGDDYAGRHKEPLVNLSASVRSELYLDDARQFFRQASFSPGSEPKLDAGVNAIPRPIAFPTRPFTTAEISLLDQTTLSDWAQFRRWVRALRGRIFDKNFEAKSPPQKNPEELDRESIVFIPNSKVPRKPLVALPALATDDRSWKASVMGHPEPDGERYFRINRLINDALKCRPRPHYFVLPELSLPRRWFNLAAHRLEHSGISLIAGLEYEHWSPPGHSGPKPFVSNQVRAALITDVLGYQSLFYYQQEKQRPAPEEEKLLTQLGSKTLAGQFGVSPTAIYKMRKKR